MNLILTIFRCQSIEFTINIQPRRPYGMSDEEAKEQQLIVRHTSKIGNQSLIFNPRVCLTMKPNRFVLNVKDDPIPIIIPDTLYYRFTGVLSTVYTNMINSKKLYHRDENNVLFVDRKESNALARKLVLYGGTLVIYPTVVTTRNWNSPDRDAPGIVSPGIGFQFNGKNYGFLSREDASSAFETLDHIDIKTYVLLATAIERLDHLDQKTDEILFILRDIQKKLTDGTLTAKGKSEQDSSMFDMFRNTEYYQS